VAPGHRHTQSAFRFIIEGEGVWTVVDGDPVSMHRGDLLLTAGWSWHEHHNVGEGAMIWLDGLDIPLISALDAGFFEFGPDFVTDRSTPSRSRSERLWGRPGLRPVGAPAPATSPLLAYRWEHTDAALTAQLELQNEGHGGAAGPGHAAVRFTNPANGADALLTLRLEMHRLAPGAATSRTRTVGSSVWHVHDGAGDVEAGDGRFEVGKGDVLAVPSWCPVRIRAADGLDLFTFADAPVYEALGLARSAPEGGAP
jgi:gentisate 1,2-dioxygenase